MKVSFIVAKPDHTWEDRLEDVPSDVIPDKYSRGSTKWNKKAISWLENELPEGSALFVGVLDANPNNE